MPGEQWGMVQDRQGEEHLVNYTYHLQSSYESSKPHFSGRLNNAVNEW